MSKMQNTKFVSSSHWNFIFYRPQPREFTTRWVFDLENDQLIVAQIKGALPDRWYNLGQNEASVLLGCIHDHCINVPGFGGLGTSLLPSWAHGQENGEVLAKVSMPSCASWGLSKKQLTLAPAAPAAPVQQQGPVGEVNRYGLDSHGRKWHGIHWRDHVDVPHGTKLYTTPQAQTAKQAPVSSAAKDAIMGAAYDFRDAHLSESGNLKRAAHAELEGAVDAALADSNYAALVRAKALHLEASQISAFMYAGAIQCNLDRWDGHVGFVANCAEVSLDIAGFLKENAGTENPGVIAYELFEPFGKWMAEEGHLPLKNSLLDEFKQQYHAWIEQGQACMPRESSS